MEEFEDFLKNIPESVAKPLESIKGTEEILDESDLLVNELGILKESESEKSKETQIGMLPKVKELISGLREVQAKNDKNYEREGVQNALARLINERDRIEKMIN
ncbi:MAG: hypothetical protein HY432_02475 [Candidatus Liptonbacteria bacterium]|nr:hypothetical protein [Candidatus Liptonbacteria bacterium]